ncbi:MAG TPA: hypothetical protein VHY09_09645 [Candidatus Methylacidiphilales bacterium]|nr:hypothetical protein [Candidatus Methylacidiphilales bacterium]
MLSTDETEYYNKLSKYYGGDSNVPANVEYAYAKAFGDTYRIEASKYNAEAQTIVGAASLAVQIPLALASDGASLEIEAAANGGKTILYRGTSQLAKEDILANQAFDVDRIAQHQAAAGADRSGVFVTTQESTAYAFADAAYGAGRNGGPAVVKIEVQTVKLNAYLEQNGIDFETPVDRPPPGASKDPTETLLPFNTIDEFHDMATFH